MVYKTQSYREYYDEESISMAKTELGGKEYRLYKLMRKTHNFTNPTYNIYAKLLNVSVSTIKRRAKVLVDKNFLFMQKLTRKDGGTKYDYYLGRQLVTAILSPSDKQVEIREMLNSHRAYIKAVR